MRSYCIQYYTKVFGNSTLHSPLSTLHSTLSTLNTPHSTLHTPLSTLDKKVRYRMNCFITEQERKKDNTTFFEFQKGTYSGKCWLDDSMLLDADLFDEYHLSKLFKAVLPDFDYYGTTVFTREDWLRICGNAKNTAAEELLNELSPWIDDCFNEYDTVSLLGL